MLIFFRIDWFDLAVQRMVAIKQEPKVGVRVSQAKGQGDSIQAGEQPLQTP